MATFGTFSSGQVLTAAELNTVLPACVLTATGVSVANATDTYIPFSTEEYDPLGWHSTSSNNSRITPNIAGWYLCTATLNGMNPAGGNHRVINLVNRNRASATVLDNQFARFDINNYGPDDCSVAGITYLNGSTDYVEMVAVQNSGVTRTVSAQLTCTLVAR